MWHLAVHWVHLTLVLKHSALLVVESRWRRRITIRHDPNNTIRCINILHRRLLHSLLLHIRVEILIRLKPRLTLHIVSRHHWRLIRSSNKPRMVHIRLLIVSTILLIIRRSRRLIVIECGRVLVGGIHRSRLHHLIRVNISEWLLVKMTCRRRFLVHRLLCCC